MTVQRVLTGITTSGTPHLGNYAGAIRPAIAASRRAGVESFYFLADYHALIKTTDPLRVQRSTLEIAATWLAAGLDTERVWFYRQSDIPEIPELTWLVTCVAGKGLLNRAHAYKAAVDRNVAEGLDADTGVNMGLYMYPVLMAADILLFKAHSVPVGRDQIQHIEMARDIAGSFNHIYGEHFVLPEAAIDASVATLPGLDGRKMSKSYDNTIPLFAPPAELKKLIFSIVTDSKVPGEPKNADTSALFDKIESSVAPMREKYDALIADPTQIERLLHEGAAKARAIATPFIGELRHAVGLRNLAAVAKPVVSAKTKAALPQFKQYREADGRFHFKLVDAEGGLLLQGEGFASPREAGGVVSALKQGAAFEMKGSALWLAGAPVGVLADGVDAATLSAALAALGS